MYIRPDVVPLSPEDEQLPGPDDGEPEYTICPDCGEDLQWHICGERHEPPPDV